MLMYGMLFAGGPEKPAGSMINGVSVTSPRSQVNASVLDPIVEVNANWITLLPYGYSRQNRPKVAYDTGFQWWGETPAGTKTMALYAKSKGMKVMIKPQIWIPGSWAGGFTLDNEEDWQEWERQYETMILEFAGIAEATHSEMLCIGTEYKLAVQERPEFWKQLIRKVRKVYSGKLTYAANWDNFHKIPFWAELDYIGVDAYFPLTFQETPTIEMLKKSWREPFMAIKTVHQNVKKPVIFTEYGYKSIHKTAWRQWEFESTPASKDVNLEAQENAYQAIYDVFWEEPWFHGGFIWKWYVDHDEPGGLKNSDYTPQNKPALKLIREVYGRG